MTVLNSVIKRWSLWPIKARGGKKSYKSRIAVWFESLLLSEEWWKWDLSSKSLGCEEMLLRRFCVICFRCAEGTGETWCACGGCCWCVLGQLFPETVFRGEHYLLFVLSNFCCCVTEQLVLFITGNVSWFIKKKIKNLQNRYKCQGSDVLAIKCNWLISQPGPKLRTAHRYISLSIQLQIGG